MQSAWHDWSCPQCASDAQALLSTSLRSADAWPDPCAPGTTAPNFALDAVSDRLRVEVKPFGIDVVVIEPDAIRTEFAEVGSKRSVLRPLPDPTARSRRQSSSQWQMKTWSDASRHPREIADAIHRAMIARHPNPRSIAGFITSLLLFARRMLPDTSLDAAVTAAFATQA